MMTVSSVWYVVDANTFMETEIRITEEMRCDITVRGI